MEFAPIAPDDMSDHVLCLRYYIFHTHRETLRGYFKTYLLTEFLTFATLASQWLMWDFIFDWQFRLLGVRYANYFLDTYYWGTQHRNPMFFYFPPRGACRMDPPSLAHYQYDVNQLVCTMPQNYFYQTVRYNSL